MLQSLLLAALGGILAIAGAVTGQYLQIRNNQRVRTEEYDREDRYRLFRDRLDAYREYHVAAGLARREMALYSRWGDPAQLETLKQAREKAWRAYSLVWLIGKEEAVSAASVVLDMIDNVTWHEAKLEPERWKDGIQAFVEAARDDLLQGNDQLR